MPERSTYIASGILHLGLVLMLLFGLPNFFSHKLPEPTPLVVRLVQSAPETRATKLTQTPPTPEAEPEPVDEPTPKPEPPKPEPPKPPPPQVEPPPQAKPPVPQPPPPPEPPPPAPPLPKPAPPAPPPPAPEPKPAPKPEPKPVPAPPLPTPPAPKPAPPQPKPAPQPPSPAPPPPKPTPPKPRPDQNFDSLLKNLSKNDPTRTEPRQTAARDNAPARPRASSQPVAPLGAQLTMSEKDLVMQQINRCWYVPQGARGAENLTPEFRLTMNPDGTVRAAQLLNTERMSDPFFRSAAESARRALFNPQCSPLKLPLDKYREWQTFTVTFDPRDAIE